MRGFETETGTPWYAVGAGDTYNRWLLALFSGVLLGIPWVYPSFSSLIFVAWLPLFQLEAGLRRQGKTYLLFNYALVSFLLWNILGTWWIARAYVPGAVLIILTNALLQAACFRLASGLGKHVGAPFILPFTLIWMGFEHFHEWWDLAWPWLNLGNALASSPVVVQWYEYTGARGGTLWIILANFAALKVHRDWVANRKKPLVRSCTGFLLVLLLPSLASWQIFRNVAAGSDSLPFVLVQPNLDPYTQKFVPEAQAGHLDAFFKTADASCDSKTRLLLGPETLILNQIDEKDPTSSSELRRMKAFQQKYPQLSILLGAHSFEKIPAGKVVPGSRCDPEKRIHFEAFNSALFLAPASTARFYHKTKLVPLFERVPFLPYLGFLGRFSLELGGYVGTYSNRQARSFFKAPGDAPDILPIVCFESVFGSYCARRLSARKGIAVMITNDGWWKHTPGYRYHFNFSRLRAIECRRDLIRAANNGISALIDARGTVVARTSWWQPAVLKGEAHLRAGRTFFSRHGDYLGKATLLCACVLCLWAAVCRRRP
ncbi:MAG: apolipoprotein N-acyltransferase [Deltaproteobacteria bacterium]|nr:apolipoprotein N-acyltransferase [Deltaproteobacteria bacterium]